MERKATITLVTLLLAASAAEPAEPKSKGEAKASGEAEVEFTLGLAQRALKEGLSQAEVAERLGAPNIVARDAAGREAWIYDKVAREFQSSGRQVGIGGGLSGAGDSTLGLFGLRAGGHSEKAKSSQKTLTVVVRFSPEGAVESFTYHQSRF
jgi:hypothetical protein